MVRSYSAMAISSRASATLRLPFLAPQSKMGRLIEGPKLQLSPSFPIKFPRSVEAKPILPVSEMDGKKAARAAPILARAARSFRSEEHTSELQSLMRISYAVFCLKKKHTHTYNPQQATHETMKK